MAAVKGSPIVSWRDKSPLEWTPEEEAAAEAERVQLLRSGIPTESSLMQIPRTLAGLGIVESGLKPTGPELRFEQPGVLAAPPPVPTPEGPQPAGPPIGAGVLGAVRRIRRAGRVGQQELSVIELGAKASMEEKGSALGELRRTQRERTAFVAKRQEEMEISLEARAEIEQKKEQKLEEIDERISDLRLRARNANAPAWMSSEQIRVVERKARGEGGVEAGEELMGEPGRGPDVVLAALEGREGTSPKEQRQARRQLEQWSKVTPAGGWSTGRKIMSAIGMALGAAASAQSGGRIPNYAMQIVENAINRDIASQKDAFERAKGRVTAERNAWSMARTAFSDKLAANDAARSIRHDQAAFMMKDYAAQAANIVQQQQLMQMLELTQTRALTLMNSARDRQYQSEVAAGGLEARYAEMQPRGALAGAKGPVAGDPLGHLTRTGERERAEALTRLHGQVVALEEMWEREIAGAPTGLTAQLPGTQVGEAFDIMAQDLGREAQAMAEDKRITNSEWDFVKEIRIPKAGELFGTDWSRAARIKMKRAREKIVSGLKGLQVSPEYYGAKGGEAAQFKGAGEPGKTVAKAPRELGSL